MPMTLQEELDHRLYNAQECLRLISVGAKPHKIVELHEKARGLINECVRLREDARAEEAEAAEKGRAHAA